MSSMAADSFPPVRVRRVDADMERTRESLLYALSIRHLRNRMPLFTDLNLESCTEKLGSFSRRASGRVGIWRFYYLPRSFVCAVLIVTQLATE
jgi:hypothetical protein